VREIQYQTVTVAQYLILTRSSHSFLKPETHVHFCLVITMLLLYNVIAIYELFLKGEYMWFNTLPLL